MYCSVIKTLSALSIKPSKMIRHFTPNKGLNSSDGITFRLSKRVQELVLEAKGTLEDLTLCIDMFLSHEVLLFHTSFSLAVESKRSKPRFLDEGGNKASLRTESKRVLILH